MRWIAGPVVLICIILFIGFFTFGKLNTTGLAGLHIICMGPMREREFYLPNKHNTITKTQWQTATEAEYAYQAGRHIAT